MDTLQEAIKSAAPKLSSPDFDTSADDIIISTRLSDRFATISGIIFLFFLGWLSVADLEQTVVARGKIVTLKDKEKVQHLEGGIIEEILVKEGDYVTKGQPLAKLKALEREAELEKNREKIIDLRVELETLIALYDQRTPDFSVWKDHEDVIDLSEKQYQTELAAFKSEIETIKATIESQQDKIKSMQSREKETKYQMSLIQEQVAMKDRLYREETSSYMEVLDSRIQLSNMNRELMNISESILIENNSIRDNELKILTTTFNTKKQWLDQILKKKQQLDELETTEAYLKDKVDRMTIRSPVDGIVDNLPLNYNSAVLGPKESLAEIIAYNSNLIAELKVNPKDIGFVREGTPVNVKFDTFIFTEYGVINGTIYSISQTTFNEEDETFYVAKVQMDQNFIEKNGIKYPIKVDMDISADIMTGSRTAIDYALKPVTNALEEAFRER